MDSPVALLSALHFTNHETPSNQQQQRYFPHPQSPNQLTMSQPAATQLASAQMEWTGIHGMSEDDVSKIEENFNSSHGIKGALSFDFDGTLIHIGEKLPKENLEFLWQLQQLLGFGFAINTAQKVEYIDKFTAPYKFNVIGVEGMEKRITFPDYQKGGYHEDAPIQLNYQNAHECADLFNQVNAAVEGTSMKVNTKGLGAFAVDYTQEENKDAIGRVKRLFENYRQTDHDIKYTRGFVDVISKGYNKGRAIRDYYLCVVKQVQKPLVIHFGDGSTDEVAFSEIRITHYGGIGIGVKRDRFNSFATSFLDSVEDTYKLLRIMYTYLTL